MTITKKNYITLKAAALEAADNLQEVLKAIQETEKAAADHNEKMVAYITEKRKNNKNYCRQKKPLVKKSKRVLY